MSANGPPEVEHLLTKVRRWIRNFAGVSFWPSAAQRPPDDPVSPGLHEVEVEPGENASPPPQNGMGGQQGHAVPFPLYYAVPYPVHYAVPVYYPAPYPAPYAVPFLPFAVPHPHPDYFPNAAPAFPHADPYAAPYAHPHAAPASPRASPQPAPAFPAADPVPHAAPAFPDADPVHDADLGEAVDQLIAMYRHGPPLVEDDEGDEEEIEVLAQDAVAVSSVDNIGPLSPSSTSGLSSSTRRRREDSDGEEAAAKRPRWSDESDSD